MGPLGRPSRLEDDEAPAPRRGRAPSTSIPSLEPLVPSPAARSAAPTPRVEGPLFPAPRIDSELGPGPDGWEGMVDGTFCCCCCFCWTAARADANDMVEVENDRVRRDKEGAVKVGGVVD